MRFVFSGSSQKNKRPTNQDSLYIKSGLICGNQSLLAVVCDGVGSLNDGEFAGITAVIILKNWFEIQLQKKIIDNNVKNVGNYLIDEIKIINEKIIKISKSINIKTATTISVLLIIGNTYFIRHLGDSRIYKINNGEILQLTEDYNIEREYIKSEKNIKRLNLNALARCAGYYDKIEAFTQKE